MWKAHLGRGGEDGLEGSLTAKGLKLLESRISLGNDMFLDPWAKRGVATGWSVKSEEKTSEAHVKLWGRQARVRIGVSGAEEVSGG